MKTMNQIKNLRRGCLCIALFISGGLISCSNTNSASPNEVGLTTPSDADGYLIASRTSEDGASSTFNQAQAAFSNTPGVRGSLVNVGTVKCNNVTCTNASNAYVSVTSNFSSGNLKWEVSGGSGFGPFTKDGLTFPSKPVVTSSDNVSKSGYTVTNTAVTGADKILYTIGSQATPSKLKLKWASSASSTSMSYSASDLSGFSTGEHVGVIVTAYKLSTETLGGKRIYIQIASQDVMSAVIN